MDILAGLKAKLRFIERFYQTASLAFRETIRKIEAEEDPFMPPQFDPDHDYPDPPPFFEEWEEADDSLNLVGQTAVSLAQSALREYLDGFIRLSKQQEPAGGGNWFKRYKTFFLETYGIDWDHSPIAPDSIEEINLTRNDIHHSGREFGIERRMSREHRGRFPRGIFAYKPESDLYRDSNVILPSIYVTEENLTEAIRRVEKFCEFLDEKR